MSTAEGHQQAISVIQSPSAPQNDSNNNNNNNNNEANKGAMDFIGPSHAVKDLFMLPYSNTTVSVAVHNMDGTLLMEADVNQEEMTPPRKPLSRRRRRPDSFGLPDSDDVLVPPPPTHVGEDALAMVTSMLRLPPPMTREGGKEETASGGVHPLGDKHSDSTLVLAGPAGTLTLPSPEQYRSMPSLPQPRQYLPWRFYDQDLLVGSDVVIYQSHRKEEDTVLRVEEVSEMKSLVRAQQGKIQEQTGRSYAQALKDDSPKRGAGAPDLDQVELQTCIVPSPPSSGGLGAHATPAASTSTASPVCTVMDAYLDNIIANVPQLALCLREQGFIQSVKLFRTEDIPSSLMHASTLDVEGTTVSCPDEPPLFSPQIMEMNASTLLRFLKANCTRDNSTYMLRREAGETNIQLFDITSISSQRHRKWIWWLAMMSYRFALRLGQLSTQENDQILKRTYRGRQRRLLETAQELLADLADMDGGAHETWAAAVREHLADTFLASDSLDHSDGLRVKQIEADLFGSASSAYGERPFGSVPMDALTKAQDHLLEGIRILWPLLERTRAESSHKRHSSDTNPVTVDLHNETDSSSDDDSDTESTTMSAEVTLQLFGLHHKLVDVSLRLSEHNLKNYSSSSAMQALRTAARRLKDAIDLVMPLKKRSLADNDMQRLQLGLCYQYTLLWEHCGLFARSFAADTLWRERGHACGDDVISVLRDVETALSSDKDCGMSWLLGADEERLSKVSGGLVNLHSLSGVLNRSVARAHSGDTSFLPGPSILQVAKSLMDGQPLLKQDRRRVLVSACVAYSCAITGGRAMDELSKSIVSGINTSAPNSTGNILVLLLPRLGDACNEIGKILLEELRSLLSARPDTLSFDADKVSRVAHVLLGSAQFWFMEGLQSFEECHDLRNIALLRCNLCQCCKLRSNSLFAPMPSKDASDCGAPTHAELCLQDAAEHLQKAHDAMGVRDVDPVTWDMVSTELAATFLVLGVRRRQSLLGGGSTPVIFEAMRLSPGKERSIVDPMERSLTIYEQLGNAHQAAATNYQMALFYSKVWTCQRDEAKTRDKLSKAFRHFHSAHAYFSQACTGNEPTYVILCLDLANLYAAVSGEECLWKALKCCLDTADAFAIDSRGKQHNTEYLSKMGTLASETEERILKLLVSLVRLEKGPNQGGGTYKELYREALATKMKSKSDVEETVASQISTVRQVLSTLRDRAQKIQVEP